MTDVTYQVALWIHRDRRLHATVMRMAGHCYVKAEASWLYSKVTNARTALARRLHDLIAEDRAPCVDGMYGTLLDSALEAVDWDTLAAEIIQEVESGSDL